MGKLWSAALAATMLSGATWGQDPPGTRVSDGAIKPVPANASAEIIKLSTVMRSKVLIQNNQSVGQVTDVVLSDGGCIDYVVASYDDQYYAIPYSAVMVRSTDRVVFVDITPAQFKQVTFFAANQWPDFYATSFQRTNFAAFGVNSVRVNTHTSGKVNLDRADDRQDRREDLRDNRIDRRDDRRDRNTEGTAGEKGAADAPRDRSALPDRKTAPDPKDDQRNLEKAPAPKKPDTAPNPGVIDPPAPKPDAGRPDPKTEKPKVEQPKAEAPKPKPIAPSAPKPKNN